MATADLVPAYNLTYSVGLRAMVQPPKPKTDVIPSALIDDLSALYESRGKIPRQDVTVPTLQETKLVGGMWLPTPRKLAVLSARPTAAENDALMEIANKQVSMKKKRSSTATRQRKRP